MAEWRRDAMRAVALAEVMHDDYRPTYRVPVPRKWWQFWKRQEWETVTGLSRNDCRRVQRAFAPNAESPQPRE